MQTYLENAITKGMKHLFTADEIRLRTGEEYIVTRVERMEDCIILNITSKKLMGRCVRFKFDFDGTFIEELTKTQEEGADIIEIQSWVV